MKPHALVLGAALMACGQSQGAAVKPGGLPTVGTLGLSDIASGLNNPLYLTAPAGDPRLFIVEQSGRIRIIRDGTLLTTPFLDISAKVKVGAEQGLFSVAFHPAYSANGLFFVNYTNLRGNTRVERYTVSSNGDLADPASGKMILAVDQPFANHNGGLNLFGPDGMLYVGMGDGGGGGDPHSNAQNRNVLLGKLLRIDVDHGDPYAIPSSNPFAGGGGRGEIWATGLRNPWRFAFDESANTLYIGDVGQNKFEEIDVVSADRAGVNYGWNILEGGACYGSFSCDQKGLQVPAASYGREDGACSVIGGMVYRGSGVPRLSGHYLYADLCTTWIRSFKWVNNAAGNSTQWESPSHGPVLSFGADSSGEMYVLSANGHVYKIVER